MKTIVLEGKEYKIPSMAEMTLGMWAEVESAYGKPLFSEGKCSVCGGTGRVENKTADGAQNDACAACEGTGLVSVVEPMSMKLLHAIVWSFLKNNNPLITIEEAGKLMTMDVVLSVASEFKSGSIPNASGPNG